ncbi:MAG: hypothetical protein OXC18_04900 [Desulfurellaceae bacterium]|nr:hypothetical protein [Desulfurellaceae bacterium]
MFKNVELLLEELKRLGYVPQQFDSPMRHCRGEGIKFEYQIADGSRTGETVLLGLVIPESAGSWPEGTPHWIHISPPDGVLEEQVQAHRGGSRGCVERYKDQEGVEWMAISAPVEDFWDKINEPNGKNAEAYIERHLRRIWAAR